MKEPMDNFFAAARGINPETAWDDAAFADTLRRNLAGSRMAQAQTRTLTRGLAALFAVALCATGWFYAARPVAGIDYGVFFQPDAALQLIFAL
jgi:hypothetical protein